MTTYAKKADVNQREIVQALRQAGASVQPIYRLGRGVPDILCGFRGKNFLLEIKNGRNTLTPDEALWLDSWRGQAAIVRTIDEALEAIGALARQDGRAG